jgi:amino acid transporter
VGILASGVIFVVASYAGIIAFPNAAAYAADPSPFTTATKQFIHPLGGAIEALFLTSVTASFIIANSQTSRVIFSGAREGLWPRSIARIHPRFNTPWLAAIAFVVPSLAIAGLAMLFTTTDLGTVSGFLSTLGTLGIIFMYAMTNVSLVVLWFRERRQGRARSVWTWLVVPILGAAVMAIPYWANLKSGQTPPYNLLPWYFAIIVVLALGYTTWFHFRRPELIKNAGALVMGESSLEGEPAGGA